MIQRNITAYPCTSPANTAYLYLIKPSRELPIGSAARVAEEPGEYRPGQAKSTLAGAVKKIQVEALRRTADVQIGRLLRLANLIDGPQAINCTTEDRPLYAAEIRQATSQLESHLHAIAAVIEDLDDTGLAASVNHDDTWTTGNRQP